MANTYLAGKKLRTLSHEMIEDDRIKEISLNYNETHKKSAKKMKKLTYRSSFIEPKFLHTHIGRRTGFVRGRRRGRRFLL